MIGSRPPAPGPLMREATRVRHRHTRREGRIAPDPASTGFVAVLFDGDARPRNVPLSAVEYLDVAGQNWS